MKRSPSRQIVQRGTTLIEIMVAAGILGLVMTSIVAIITLSVKDVAEAKARAVAVKYAQEGMEVFRRQRNLVGWETFVQSFANDGAGVGNPLSYCLPTIPNSAAAFEALSSSECSAQDTGDYVDSRQIFLRQVNATVPAGGNVVEVLSTVTWTEGSSPKQSTLVEKFQKGGTW